MKKQVAFLLIGLGFATAPMFAFASDLSIYNNTPYDSTCSIHGVCTTKILGSGGIIPPGLNQAHHTISSAKVKLACGTITGNCDADLYEDDDTCSGTKIGTVHFNVANGYIGYDPTDPKYTVNGAVGSFNLEVDKIG